MEGLLEAVAGGAAGEGAALIHWPNPFDGAVNADLPGFDAIERFAFGGEPGMCGGQIRGVLVEILVAIPNDVAEKSPCLVIQVVPDDQRLKPFPDREAIQELAFEHAADGADFASHALVDLGNGVAKKLLDGILDPGERSSPSEIINGFGRCLGKAFDSEPNVKASGRVAQIMQDVPRRQGVLAAGDGHKQGRGGRNREFFQAAPDGGLEEGYETIRAEVGVV